MRSGNAAARSVTPPSLPRPRGRDEERPRPGTAHGARPARSPSRGAPPSTRSGRASPRRRGTRSSPRWRIVPGAPPASTSRSTGDASPLVSAASMAASSVSFAASSRNCGSTSAPGIALAAIAPPSQAETAQIVAARSRASSSAHESARADTSEPSTPTTIRSAAGSGSSCWWITATGQVARWRHFSLTEPSRSPRNPPLPRAPTTSRSAPSDAVTSARHGRSTIDFRPTCVAASAPSAATTHVSSAESASFSS